MATKILLGVHGLINGNVLAISLQHVEYIFFLRQVSLLIEFEGNVQNG